MIVHHRRRNTGCGCANAVHTVPGGGSGVAGVVPRCHRDGLSEIEHRLLCRRDLHDDADVVRAAGVDAQDVDLHLAVDFSLEQQQQQEHGTACHEPHSGSCDDSAVQVKGSRDRALAAALPMTKSGTSSARRPRRCGRLRLRAQRGALAGLTLLPVAVLGTALQLYAPAVGEHPRYPPRRAHTAACWAAAHRRGRGTGGRPAAPWRAGEPAARTRRRWVPLGSRCDGSPTARGAGGPADQSPAGQEPVGRARRGWWRPASRGRVIVHGPSTWRGRKELIRIPIGSNDAKSLSWP